jgi:filamentous hemagglutinin family protein
MQHRLLLFCLSSFSLGALSSPPHVIVGDVQGPYLQGNEWVIQSGDKAIVHWNEFSIGAEETVRFQQLGNTSAILNRVVGSNSSEILGALLSNGRVYVINPQGVLIGPNARIESAAFIASSLDILDQDFLEQKTILFSGEGRGMIVNLGTIACERGSVALIGQVVKNEGTIRAPEGAISLGVGSEILLQLESSPHVIIRTAITEGTLTHTGVIEALEIELKSGSSVYTQAIQCSGIVEATTVGSRNGKIILFAPESECFVDGKLLAPGGTIHILGEQVHLHDKALLDVSGAYGGGEILIGGDYQGTNPDIPNAMRTFVDQDVLLKADALDTGNGGKVIVWSDDETIHYGKISVRGGPHGGDGGMAEVSGKQLIYRGFTDGVAPLGKIGTLLLDPNDIAINASATTGSFTGCGTPPSTYTITSGTATNNILNTALVTQLQSCNVTISTVGSAGSGPNNGSISVTSAIGAGSTWTAATTLTLNAASFISITAPITNTSASSFTALSLTANGSSGTGYDGITTSGSGTITTTGGNVVLSGKGVRTSGTGYCINIGAAIASTSGNITFQNCTGGGSSTAAMNGVNTTANVTSTTGMITFSNITAGGGSGAGVGLIVGATVNAATVIASGIQGNTSGTASNYGIQLITNGIVGGSSNTSVSLTATGGGTTDTNYGIYMVNSSSQIRTADGGSITLFGTGGGGGSGQDNVGTNLLSGTVTVGSSTGATLVIQGTGGGASGGLNDGGRINSTLTISGGSTIRFRNLQGGGGSASYGLSLDSNVIVGTGSNGSIIFGGVGTPIVGGTSDGEGVALSSSISAGTITASHVTGGGGTSFQYGFDLVNTGIIGDTAFPQTISITATGGGTLSTNYGISAVSLSQIKTGDGGSITLNGTGGGGSTGSGNTGVQLSGILTVGSSTGATLTIQGTGGTGTSGGNHGAVLTNALSVSSGSTIRFQNLQGGAGAGSNGLSISSANVIVGTGSTGSITFGGMGTPIAAGSSGGIGVSISASTISAATITASNITGGGSTTTQTGFNLGANALIGSTSFPQTISITATGGGTTSTNSGIRTSSSTARIRTGDGGSITLNGTAGGGTTGNQNFGISLLANTIILGSSTGATLTLQGTGGAGSGGSNHGVNISSMTITGNSTVNFQNCQGGAGASSHGVNLSATYTGSGDVVFSSCTGGTGGGNGINIGAAFTTTGNITATTSITGQGSGGVGFFSGFDFSTTGAGKTIAITASATGTTGGCHGISLTGGILSTIGSSTIDFNGTGGVSSTPSYGIYITGSGSKVTSVNGNITLVGQGFGSPAYGIVLEASGNPSVSTTGTGSISFSTTSSSTYLNSANNPVVSSTHNATFNNAVVLNAATSTIDTSTNNGTLTFSSTINGTSSGANSLTLTAGSGMITLDGSVGTTFPLNALTATGGSLEVSDINTSGIIMLQPASGFTSTSLGNLPDGTIILNGHLTGGAISLAPTGRTAPLSVASITSSLLGNDITIIGSSLTIGPLEALTVLGNLTINVSGAIAVGDVVSLDMITLIGGSLTLYERGPASLLDFLGILNESLESHIFARTTVQRTISGAQSINGIIEGFGVSSRSAFETLLIYTPDSLILNLGGVETSSLLLPLPAPLLFVMPLIIANTQMEELLPNSWHRDFFLPWQKKLWIHKKIW